LSVVGQRSITSTPTPQQGGTDAQPVPVDRRLHSLEAKLDGSSARAHTMMQEMGAELMRVRALLDETDKRLKHDANELKKVAASQYITTTLFLVYLFVISTWMMMLMTDLSGHMHGIPGQRRRTQPTPVQRANQVAMPL
jgi:hypothetical protein